MFAPDRWLLVFVIDIELGLFFYILLVHLQLLHAKADGVMVG